MSYYDQGAVYGAGNPSADPYDTSAAPDETGAGAIASIVNWAGAVVSLGLVVGVAVWGYNLAMRDVSGVPVIQALEGPMRIQPDDPGGRQAEHQGLAVNRVQADGVASAPADQIVLAPRPLDLTNLAPVSADGTPTPQTESSASTAEQDPAAAALALAEQLSQAAGNAVPSEAVDAAVLAAVATTPTFRTPRPVARPSDAQITRAAAIVPAPPAVTSFVDPTTIAAGTRMVQFGAYDSNETARAEWAKIEDRFGQYLTEQQPVIQEAVSGGRSFHRLRATGFTDVSDARRFCAVFLAENVACIPVVFKP